MKLTKDGRTLTVSRTDTDTKLYTESAFWHALKAHINVAHKQDLVKRLMARDGHMADENVYYLRDRKWHFCILDNQAALRDVSKDYRETGSVDLHIVDWEPAKPQFCTAFLNALPLASTPLAQAEETYLAAAEELRCAQLGLANHAQALHVYLQAQEVLEAHPDFTKLPTTFFTVR